MSTEEHDEQDNIKKPKEKTQTKKAKQKEYEAKYHSFYWKEVTDNNPGFETFSFDLGDREVGPQQTSNLERPIDFFLLFFILKALI